MSKISIEDTTGLNGILWFDKTWKKRRCEDEKIITTYTVVDVKYAATTSSKALFLHSEMRHIWRHLILRLISAANRARGCRVINQKMTLAITQQWKNWTRDSRKTAGKSTSLKRTRWQAQILNKCPLHNYRHGF